MAIDTIKSSAVLDGAIATADIADDAVTQAKVAGGAIGTTELAGSIPDSKIAAMAASKLTGAMPALNGSALTNVTGASMVKLASTTVASGSATDYAFNFTNVFSSTYDDYFFVFKIVTNETGNSADVKYAQFGMGAKYVTSGNACRGASGNRQVNTNMSGGIGGQFYYSTTGIHQLLGTVTSTENAMFTGHGLIMNANDSNLPTQIFIGNAFMQYLSTEGNTWFEDGASREDNGDQASYTDVRFGVIIGNSAGTNIASSADRRNVYGKVTIYGMVK